jgi:hypothetical protein
MIMVPAKGLESRYRKHGESILIELNLHSVMQLFNSLDPSPFHDKDLDDNAVKYIVGTAQEFPLKTPLRLHIHVPPEAVTRESSEDIGRAIHNFFEYQTEVADRELHQKLRQGRASLVIGLLFLFTCVSARALLDPLGEGMFHDILQEGLLISGWVAMWRPIQIFLYDWWPIRNRRQLCHKLTHLKVEVQPRV